MGLHPGWHSFIGTDAIRINYKAFTGRTIVVDAFSWIYKGLYSKEAKDSNGNEDIILENYYLQFFRMFKDANIKVILVLDGRRLKAKKIAYDKRWAAQQRYKLKSKKCEDEGDVVRAKYYVYKAIAPSSKHVSSFVRNAIKYGVDFVISPNEADPQMAWLSLMNMADVVVSEDSDLMLYPGIKKLFYKMDRNGDGDYFDTSLLGPRLGYPTGTFQYEKLVILAVLCGCDYANQIKGIGIMRAKEIVDSIDSVDIDLIIDQIPLLYPKYALDVTPTYRQNVKDAVNMFKFGLIVQPPIGTLSPLTPYPHGLSASDFPFAGEWMTDQMTLDIALYNIDPYNFMSNPNTNTPASIFSAVGHGSIWSKDYQPPLEEWTLTPNQIMSYHAPRKEIKKKGQGFKREEKLGKFTPRPCKDKNCGVELRNWQMWKYHLLIHRTEKAEKCPFPGCRLQFKTKSQLFKHRNSHLKPYSCVDCPRTFSTSTAANLHHHSHTGRRPYHCKTCDKKFQRPDILAQHNRIHTGERPYSCGVCQRSFTKSISLKYHMVIHTCSSPMICEECGAKFKLRHNLLRHKKSRHTDLRPHKCPQCPSSFKRLDELKRHEVEIHSDLRPFTCDTCGKSFKLKNELNRHQKRRHTDLRPHKCLQCPSTFNRLDELKQHVVVHSELRLFVCDTCGESFKLRNALTRHEKTHNISRQLHVCKTCGKSYKTLAALKLHYRHRTSLRRSFPCPICGEKYKTASAVNRHLRKRKDTKMHVNRRLRACGTCGAEFKRPDQLQRHELTHLDQRPHKCPQCPSSFKRIDELKQHEVIHSDLRPFVCDICGESFKLKNVLTRHKKRRHPHV